VAETAQETFNRLLKDVVAPTLRAAGLKGSGTSYVLPDQEWWAQVGFQKSTSSNSSVVKFTVNLSTTLKTEWDEARREHSYLKDTPPEHYNNERPHRGIDLEVPVPYSTGHRFKGVASIKRGDRLGGLIHEYRVAA
jgi:hypothetical protein